MKSLLTQFGLLVGALSLVLAAVASASAQPKNVLFIAADDLRADLGCYGATEVKTPHLDALARRGRVFERAYVQQAVCNPSRASIMTGLRPDAVRVWDLQTHFRAARPDAVTLPQHFKNHGYTTISIGKLFHNQGKRVPPEGPFPDPVSWSEPPVFANGAHWHDWVMPDGGPPPRKQEATQCLDVPDNAYFDGKIADAACAKLGELKSAGQPFFLAVGFWKPHLPFNAPKKYWDLYDRTKLAPVDPASAPAAAPAIAGHDSDELRNYGGIPKEGPIPPELAAELRHGYYASISFLDAQVGRVLAELDRLGLADDTVIVFWSDHGFHLGEHALWGKSSNYELDARAPLIVAAPRLPQPGVSAPGLVEFIDIYPTVTALCGLPPRDELQGRSLVPLLENPRHPGKPAVLSQHPRPYFNGEFTHMGYALRTARHRYVEWRENASGAVIARELYDETTDPRETINRAGEPENAALLRELSAQLRELAGENPRVLPFAAN
jgi:Arylsulfatase A and related enzymes